MLRRFSNLTAYFGGLYVVTGSYGKATRYVSACVTRITNTLERARLVDACGWEKAEYISGVHVPLTV